MCEISFRVVNLHAAIQNGDLVDPNTIRKKAKTIDADLEAWACTAPTSWWYSTIEDAESPASISFSVKRHVYPNLWVAEAWNNWRTLRILVSQIFVQNMLTTDSVQYSQRSIALSIIQICSLDLCISVASFEPSSCKLSNDQNGVRVGTDDCQRHAVAC